MAHFRKPDANSYLNVLVLRPGQQFEVQLWGGRP
jgi:hypothetical protein